MAFTIRSVQRSRCDDRLRTQALPNGFSTRHGAYPPRRSVAEATPSEEQEPTADSDETYGQEGRDFRIRTGASQLVGCDCRRSREV